MTSKLYWIVVEWRADGRYLLGSAVGSRVFFRRESAWAYRDRLNVGLSKCQIGPSYVVRSHEDVDVWGCTISKTGRISLAVDCPCADSNGADPACPHHHPANRERMAS